MEDSEEVTVVVVMVYVEIVGCDDDTGNCCEDNCGNSLAGSLTCAVRFCICKNRSSVSDFCSIKRNIISLTSAD